MSNQNQTLETSVKTTTTPRFTVQDLDEIERVVSNGYHTRDDYPPFNINPFRDRFDFEKYIYRVMGEMTTTDETDRQATSDLLVTLEEIDRLAQAKTNAASNAKALWAIRKQVQAIIVQVRGK